MAIENKSKAAEGQRQLAAYDQQLGALPGTVKKVFLTLAGDLPSSGIEWISASYSRLLSAVRSQPGSSNTYVADLCDALGRLVAVADAARMGTAGVVAAAFNDEDASFDSDAAEYIADMRLNKVAQRIWMAELAARLSVSSPWLVTLGETHGQALLNIQAAFGDPPGYLVGLQLQKRTLKAFCMPYSYPSRATSPQHAEVAAILEIIRSNFKLGQSAKPSPRRSRGFRSFSIMTMPPGRKVDEWATALTPKFELLKTAFGSAQPIRVDTAPVVTEDE